MSLPRAASSPLALAAIDAFAQAGGDPGDPDVRALVALLGEHAPALLAFAVGDPSLPADVLRLGLARRTHDPVRELTAATRSMEDGEELRRTLRRFRHRHVVRIALQEVLRLHDIDETSAAMSSLAAACSESALAAALRTVEARQGVPVLGPGGPRVPLVCLGMGKLGGWELNLGSDIDLCFFYETDDAEVVRSSGELGDLTVHEVFARAVARASAALSDVTEDGFCFRVDLRLRPEGTRGPLVNSLASAERYYESWGRTWERAALLRARPIAGDLDFGARLLEAIRPFVFRRTVDPRLAQEMASMIERSRREMGIDSDRDVKLGRGGIREAEFFVQSLQLIWGGQHPELQVPGTIAALSRLRAAGLVSDGEAHSLAAAWARMRRIEHRIHAWLGYQTHRLPSGRDEIERFARSLGYRDADALERQMREDRACIARLFDSLLESTTASGGEAPRRDPLLDQLADEVSQSAPLEVIAGLVERALPVRDPEEAAGNLLRLSRRADAPLGSMVRASHPDLAPRILEEISTVADPDLCVRGLADVVGKLRGWSWTATFTEEPRRMRRLISLLGTSGTLSNLLIGHPEDLDALLVPSVIDIAEIDALHDALADELTAGAPDDLELAVSVLRRLKRQMTLRVGLALSSGELALERCVHLLSHAAERQTRLALTLASREAVARYGPPARTASGAPASMVVVGMGKLGGRELGFGGDLDLAFLYDEDGETEGPRSITHAELFTRIAQRTMRLLSQPDGEGPGYPTDTRLRPSGSQGTLVVSLDAFERYHAARAAPWERQALTRARPIAVEPDAGSSGDPKAPGALERVRRSITHIAFSAPPAPATEMAEMRARIQRELAGESADRFHPKLGHGGLVDVEFLAQWLSMAVASRRSPEEAATWAALSTVAALTRLSEEGALSEPDCSALTESFMFLRAIEQRLRLFDEARDPVLRPRSRIAEQLARALRIRDRDGHEAPIVLEASYRRTAEEVRSIFERVVAPVGLTAPWASD